MRISNSYFDLFITNEPAKTAYKIVSHNQTKIINYLEFRNRAFAFANKLTNLGVGKGDVVMIFMSHQENLFPAFFGSQLIGAIPSFMPSFSPRQDQALLIKSHRILIEQICPRAIIADKNIIEALSEDGGCGIFLDPCEISGRPSEIVRTYEKISLDDIALLQHSSGTTGLKKGVQLSYRSVLNQVEAYSKMLKIDNSETVVTWLPVYHDMGLVACTILPFVLGLPVITMSPFDWMIRPCSILEEAAKVQNALIWLPNFAFHHIGKQASKLSNNTDLSSIKAIINCSEPCKSETFEYFLRSFEKNNINTLQLQTCFAMAENVFAVTQSRLGQPVTTIGVSRSTLEANRCIRETGDKSDMTILMSCGVPIDGVKIKIVDSNGEQQDEGFLGEIFVSGSSLFSGYNNQPELTKSRLVGEWYATRDIGAIWRGELYVCGRTEDLIIVAGRNLYSHEVENMVSEVLGVKPGRVAAFGVRNESAGTEDLVILAESDFVDAAAADLSLDINRIVQQLLMVTPRIVQLLPINTLIKTTSGKISRKENRARFLSGSLTTWS
jgi:acyl-CoA synthetase (AMP-forming)/AMP-acid ligase II